MLLLNLTQRMNRHNKGRLVNFLALFLIPIQASVTLYAFKYYDHPLSLVAIMYRPQTDFWKYMMKFGIRVIHMTSMVGTALMHIKGLLYTGRNAILDPIDWRRQINPGFNRMKQGLCIQFLMTYFITITCFIAIQGVQKAYILAFYVYGIRTYDEQAIARILVDYEQTHYQCCGGFDFKDWLRVHWFKRGKKFNETLWRMLYGYRLPWSCCPNDRACQVTRVLRKESLDVAPYNREGCINKVKHDTRSLIPLVLMSWLQLILIFIYYFLNQQHNTANAVAGFGLTGLYTHNIMDGADSVPCWVFFSPPTGAIDSWQKEYFIEEYLWRVKIGWVKRVLFHNRRFPSHRI